MGRSPWSVVQQATRHKLQKARPQALTGIIGVVVVGIVVTIVVFITINVDLVTDITGIAPPPTRCCHTALRGGSAGAGVLPWFPRPPLFVNVSAFMAPRRLRR